MLTPAGIRPLLELDPELEAGLDPDQVESALRDLRVAVFELEGRDIRGKWGSGSPALAGLLIADGALLREVTTARRTTAELVGPGDIIRPFSEDGEEDLPVRTEICWRIVQPVRLAAIDARLIQACSDYPTVAAALTARAVRRAQRLSVNLSISHMVRIADRLLLLFWHLSVHWGRVTPDGVVLRLPLTHQQLARMIGAERPSVSTALGQLAEEEIVTRLPSKEWLLCGPVPDDVGTLLVRAGTARAGA